MFSPDQFANKKLRKVNGETDPRSFTFWCPGKLHTQVALTVMEWGWRSWIVKEMKLGWDGSIEEKTLKPPWSEV